VFKHLN